MAKSSHGSGHRLKDFGDDPMAGHVDFWRATPSGLRSEDF
jgi:hypothetical protein